jgi:hypothetical protein
VVAAGTCAVCCPNGGGEDAYAHTEFVVALCVFVDEVFVAHVVPSATLALIVRIRELTVILPPRVEKTHRSPVVRIVHVFILIWVVKRSITR